MGCETERRRETAERVRRHAQALRRDARGAWREAGLLRQAVHEATRSRVDLSTGREWVRHHPVRALLAAAGAGYVLGGGLLAPVTGRVLAASLRLGWRWGLRGWALPMLREMALRRVGPV